MTTVETALVARRQPRGAAFDPLFKWLCASAATALLVALGGLIISLVIGGWPAFAKFGFGFFTTTTWNPVTEVYGADEAFVTGTFAGIAPVVEIDGRKITAARGPMVERLQALYLGLIAREVASAQVP